MTDQQIKEFVRQSLQKTNTKIADLKRDLQDLRKEIFTLEKKVTSFLDLIKQKPDEDPDK